MFTQDSKTNYYKDQTQLSSINIRLNYFDNRSTNASAESFNVKIKAFRSKFRGVKI
ncbi:transposase [Flavobacterium oreochromis]